MRSFYFPLKVKTLFPFIHKNDDERALFMLLTVFSLAWLYVIRVVFIIIAIGRNDGSDIGYSLCACVRGGENLSYHRIWL